MDDKTTERAEPEPSYWMVRSTPNAPLRDLVPCEQDQIRDEFSAFYRGFLTHLASWLILHGWVSDADAYDVAQDTMRLAYERWPTIEHPRAWARRTASRLCVERLSRGEMLPVEDIEDRIPRKGDTCATAVSDTLQDFMAALQTLPPRQRQVLLWAYEEYEPAEIAAELKMTPEAVRSSLWKARRKIAKIMHGQDSDQ
ncbi:RNA polymerase sigma-70 factor (ECF subfamily) [Micromonospora profundi]|uniref:RNA polymerase sigma factor n=1 Tax=Micromonospora profundi TaxID=1420889 RepID=UPI00143ADABE|nr:sigma-70 family RNA polymerase sigma factor [Micromonospora profundi]NJC13023.1 RNA polymerase sigma-70 factor (ECF subfamily) [Micromonospora profundi]